MKLLGQVSREYKGKEYKKHWIVVPNTLLDTLGWKTGDELKADVKGKRLEVKKA